MTHGLSTHDILYERVLSSKANARSELGKMGLGFMAHDFYYTSVNVKFGHGMYTLPVFQIVEFEKEIIEDGHFGASRLENYCGSQWDSIWSIRDGIIKSARKNIPSHIRPSGKVEPWAAEYIHNHDLADGFIYNSSEKKVEKKPVVKTAAIIESLNIVGGKIEGTFYMVERKFVPMTDSHGKFSRDNFRSDEEYENAQQAYSKFISNNEENGIRYVPANSSRPCEGLVLKVKKGGHFKVLATDFPHFEELKK